MDCPQYTPLKSLKALQDEITQLRAMVEWQATRIEFLDGRLRQVESFPQPRRVVLAPQYGTGDPIPSGPAVWCSAEPTGSARWPGLSEVQASEKWGGTD